MKTKSKYNAPMDIVPKLEDPELEFNEFARSKSEMRNRYAQVRLTPRGVERLKVAQAILDAFTLIGGVPAYAIWAQENQGEFYKMFAKQAPAQSDVNIKGTFVIRSPLPRNPAIDGEFSEVDVSSDA